MNEMFASAAKASQTMEDVRNQLIALNMRLDAMMLFAIDAAGYRDELLAAHMLEVYNDLHRRLQGK